MSKTGHMCRMCHAIWGPNGVIPSRQLEVQEQKNRSAFADRFLAKLSSNSLETSLALPPEASGADRAAPSPSVVPNWQALRK
jgi:hypothetical protein